jgi:Tat protein secretion system quality control protein TatD with DNase activity
VDETPKPIDKYEHYASIFIPKNLRPEKSEQYHQTLQKIVDGLPEPVRLKPLLNEMRHRIRKAQSNGQLVMIGEVGLDRSFRVPYPRNTPQDQPPSDLDNTDPIRKAEDEIATAGADEMAQKQALPVPRKTLTPFTTSTAHQLRVLEMQVELAVEFGINISLHSVKAQGESSAKLRCRARR